MFNKKIPVVYKWLVVMAIQDKKYQENQTKTFNDKMNKELMTIIVAVGGTILTIIILLVKNYDGLDGGTTTSQNRNVSNESTSENDSVGSSLSRERSSSSRAANEFSQQRYPKSECGDKLPTDPNQYPVNFYPVYLQYSERSLNIVRARYCQDAYVMTRENTGIKAIQVASFSSRTRAEGFKEFIAQRVGASSEVGEPRRVESKP
jgi:hypothetical protein